MFRHDDDEAKVLTESHEVEKEVFVTARHASHDPRDLGPTVQPLGLHGSEVWDGGQAGRADIRQKGIGNDRLTRASKNLALERYLPTDCRHGLSVCGEYENRSGGVRAWRPDLSGAAPLAGRNCVLPPEWAAMSAGHRAGGNGRSSAAAPTV